MNLVVIFLVCLVGLSFFVLAPVVLLAGAAVLVALGLLLLPWIVKGFIQGFKEERRAEDSNPSRVSDRTG